MERNAELERQAWAEIDRVKLPDEEWKLCPSFWNFGVSDKGRVLRYLVHAGNHSGRAGWQIDQTVTVTQKYYRCGGGMFVHTLVADAWLGPRPVDENGKLFVIDHIDENKHNNHPSNLRYITSSENTLRSQSSEVRSAQIKQRWANMSEERRKEVIAKGVETRRLKAEGLLPEKVKKTKVVVEKEIPWEKLLTPSARVEVMIMREVLKPNRTIYAIRTIDRCYKFVQFPEGGSAVDLTQALYDTLLGSKCGVGHPFHRYRVVEGKLLFKEAELGDTRLAEFFRALSAELYDGKEDAIKYEVL